MAGGTFTSQNKVRPGAYINTRSEGQIQSTDSQSGVVALPVELGYGPEDEVVEVTSGSDLSVFGYTLSDPETFLIGEALKQARVVLVYRLGSGEKATATEEAFSATAKYTGERGNDINVTSTANVNDDGVFVVRTYIDSRLVDEQFVETYEELESNELVDFEGSGSAQAFSTTLQGGTSTPSTAEDYSNYFEAVELYEFNTMAVPSSDETVKAAAASFIKRLRDGEGKYAQAVVANYPADSEGVINVRNGVILANDREVSAEEATAWVAAATASAGVATSRTYTPYTGAVDANPRLSHDETVKAIQNGELVFTHKRGEAVIEKDINSLTTLTPEKNQSYTKNRVLRVLDDIANNSKQTYEDNFIGRVDNDADGRELFKSNRVEYFSNLQSLGAIENFSAEDVSVKAGNEKDSVVMDVAVQPVDAMEKLYQTIRVI